MTILQSKSFVQEKLHKYVQHLVQDKKKKLKNWLLNKYFIVMNENMEIWML